MTPTAHTPPVFNSILFNQALFGSGNASGRSVEVGQGLLYPALRKAGVTLGAGRTPSPAQFQDAIDELNRLIGSLNCDRLFIYALDMLELPIDGSQTSWTIGQDPTGNSVPDFDYPRPDGVTYASLVNSSGARMTAKVLTPQQRVAGRSGIYYDRAYPVATIQFSGLPPAGVVSLELWTWHPIPQFQSVHDAAILPNGYEDALVLNLAVRMAPHFQLNVSADVRQQARESLMRLESINAPMPIASLGAIDSCGCTDGNAFVGGGFGGGTSGSPSPPVPPSSLVSSVFGRTGSVAAQAGDYSAAMVTNAVSAVGSYSDPAWITGLAWAKLIGVPLFVNTVFGRAGAVVASVGDYTAAMVTNAVNTTGSYSDPSWITALAWAKLTSVPAAFPPAAHTHAAADIVSGVIAPARLGSGVADATVYLRGDGAWAAAGSGGGGGVTSVFGRAGVVVATAGDYTAAQVTNAVSTAGSYADPAWITSLAWGKIAGAPATGVSTVFGRSGAVVATAGDYTAAQVTNAASTAGSYADPVWITSLAWSKIASAPTFVQNPFTADVDGGSFKLKNVGTLGVGIDPTSRVHVKQSSDAAGGGLRVERSGANTQKLDVFLDSTCAQLVSSFPVVLQPGGSGNAGVGTFTPQGVFQIGSTNDGTGEATNHGGLILAGGGAGLGSAGGIEWKAASGGAGYGWKAVANVGAACDLNFGMRQNASAWTEVFTLLSGGGIKTPLLPSTNPGAGSKQWWYDPADSNRVKFAA